ncbi:uncharacterized protein LOC119664186 [Teleopsis dalmanni]|uniref:uncharacterized protein LOC119664186 n=1 Tax=Teleopsis dalmanni TaxID=139649 RepID=UPI0018CD0874|nr:uncharacterized protein LOC119664186 [Teleopsis dalmanni]
MTKNRKNPSIRNNIKNVSEEHKTIEEYIPKQKQPGSYPNYTPSVIANQGPKKLTIEEYKKRQRPIRPPSPKPEIKKKRKRAGKQFQRRKAFALLYQELHLQTNKEDKIKIKREIKKLRREKKIIKMLL